MHTTMLTLLGGAFSDQIQQTSARDGYRQQYKSQECPVAPIFIVIAYGKAEQLPVEVYGVLSH